MPPKFEIHHSLTREQLHRCLYLSLQASMKPRQMMPVRLLLLIATVAYPLIIASSDSAVSILEPTMMSMLILRSAISLAVIAFTYPKPLASLYSLSSRKNYVSNPARYALYEDELQVVFKDVRTAAQPKPITYQSITALLEDAEAYYLLAPHKEQLLPVAIVLPKAQLHVVSGTEFLRFLEGKTGKTVQLISDSGQLPESPVQTPVSASSVTALSGSEKELSPDAVRFTVTHTLTHEQHRQCVMLTTKRTQKRARIAHMTLGMLLMIIFLWFAAQDTSGYILVAMMLFPILSNVFQPQLDAASSSLRNAERYEQAPVYYTLSEHSILISFSKAYESSVQLTYADIAALLEADSELYLCTSKKDAVIVLPKSSFTLEALSDLRAFLTDKTGKPIETI